MVYHVLLMLNIPILLSPSRSPLTSSRMRGLVQQQPTELCDLTAQNSELPRQSAALSRARPPRASGAARLGAAVGGSREWFTYPCLDLACVFNL